MMKGWRIYNHCWMPICCAGMEKPDLSSIKTGEIWQEGGLFAQWTTDFDCQEETGWWHIIRDKSFSLEEVKSDYRKKIKKSEKNFTIKTISGEEYTDELYAVAQSAAKSYRNSQITIEKEVIRRMLQPSERIVVFGAFEKTSGECGGYAAIIRKNNCIDFCTLNVDPSYERLRINEALTYARLLYFNEELDSGKYIDAGARCVSHNTHHQDFLQEKFHFRKAYCKLHFVINPKYRLLFAILFNFRWLVRWLKRTSAICQKVNGVMTMMDVSEERKHGWRLLK